MEKNEKITTTEGLRIKVGVGQWEKLTQEQAGEILKLVGEGMVSEAILAQVVELAPHIAAFAKSIFQAFENTFAKLTDAQKAAIHVNLAAINGITQGLLQFASNPAADAVNVAAALAQASRDMLEALRIHAAMDKEHDKTRRFGFAALASAAVGAAALIALVLRANG